MARQRISTRDGKVTKPQSTKDKEYAKYPSEIRIARQVDFKHTAYSSSWGSFLNHHGESMYGNGITTSLGSMALTYVNAQEMHAMLSNKFPDLYTVGSEVKLRKMIIDIHREFSVFVKQSDNLTTKILKDADDSDYEALVYKQREECGWQYRDNVSSEEPCDGPDSDTTRLSTNKLWRTGGFIVRSVEPYKAGMSLGLNLNHPENEGLKSERYSVIHDFLGDELGLPIHKVDSGFDPHLVFFRSFVPVSHLSMRSLDAAPEITLLAPQAIANLRV